MDCDEEIEEGQACDYALPPRARASDFNWMKGIHDKPTDNYQTPDFLKEFVKKYFKCNYDPCPVNPELDGLNTDWVGVSYVHPPGSQCMAWIQKASEEAGKGNFSYVLAPAAFNATYWREIVYPNASRIFILKVPIRLIGMKKQASGQMCLIGFETKHGPKIDNNPEILLIEPEGWETDYYKRERNRATFANR